MGAAMRYQPQGRPRVNLAHPMAQGLVDVWLPGISSRGLLTGADSSTVAGGSVKTTPAGLGFNITGTSRRYSTTILNGQPTAWLIIAARDSSAPVNCSIVRKDGTVTPLQEWDGNVRLAQFSSNNAFAGTANYGASGVLAGTLNTFCGVLGNNEYAIFSNGGPNLSVPALSTAGSGTNPFCIGGNESGGEIATPWTVVAVFAWAGPQIPNTTRLRAFSAKPWQIFDAGSSNSAYLAAIASASASGGGGAATNTAVSPAPASLGLTGYAPTVVRGASVAIGPAPGSLSIAGYAPAVTQSINTSIAPGSAGIVLTGYAPTVARTASQSQTPQPGALAITGYAPTVVRLAAQSIQLPVSSMAVRGYAPSVVQSAPVIAVSVRFNILPRNFSLKTTHFSN